MYSTNQSFVASSSNFLRSEHSPVRSDAQIPFPPKTKAELWKELRTVSESPVPQKTTPLSDRPNSSAFTRTLTLIYTLTLLTLQTHIQLNLLASSKYVQSIFVAEREQQEREGWGDLLAPLDANSTFNGIKDYIFGTSSDTIPPPAVATHFIISEATEQRYLTMNWWLLNVGWKKLMVAVEQAVHEVLDQ